MAQYLTLPNGSQFEIRQGETREQALSKALQQYPEAFGFGQAAPTEAPESGFVPALKSGIASLKSDVAALAGRTGIMDQAAAEKYIQEQADYQKRTFKPTETFGEAPITKTLELLGGSVPYMAAPIAAGALAPAGALALGAAGAASAAQFTGSNLSRQMGEGKALGETDITAAALAAVPQAALDALSLKMLPGIRSIFGQAGKEVSKDVAQAIAQQSVKEVAKDYALATGKAMGTEGLTEVGQQALERLQASLSLTDEKARDEYLESLIGGAVLGGVLSPAGRYVERGRQAKKEEADTLAAAMKQREADAKQREEALTSPEGRLAFVEDYEARQARFQELKDMAKPGKDATPLQQAEYTEIKKEKNDLGRSLYRDSAEYKKAREIAKPLLDAQKQAAETQNEQRAAELEAAAAGMGEAQTQPFFYEPQQTLPGFGGAVPQVQPEAAPQEFVDYNQQVRLLNDRLNELRTQAQQTTALDAKIELGRLYDQTQTALQEAQTLAEQQKPAAPPSPDAKLKRLRKEMAAAEEAGDLPKQVKLAERLKELGVADLAVQPPAPAVPAQGEFPMEPFKTKVSTKAEYAAVAYPPGPEDIESQEREYLAESERQREEAIQEAQREQKITPEILALRRIKAGEEPAAAEGVKRAGQVSGLIDKLGDSLRTGRGPVAGRVISGGVATDLSQIEELKAQLAYARATDNKTRQQELSKQLEDLRAPDDTRSVDDLDFGEVIKKTGVEGRLTPEAMAGNRVTRMSQAQLGAYDKLAAFVQSVRESDPQMKRTAGEERTLADAAERLKDVVAGQALLEVNTRRAQAKQEALSTEKQAELIGRVNNVLNELVFRGAPLFNKTDVPAVTRGTLTLRSAETRRPPRGRQVFPNFTAAASSLRAQMRSIMDDVGGIKAPAAVAPQAPSKAQIVTEGLRREPEGRERSIEKQFDAAFDRAKTDEDYRTLKELQQKVKNLSPESQQEALAQVRRVLTGRALDLPPQLQQELADLRQAGVSDQGQAELFAGTSERGEFRTTPEKFQKYLGSAEVQKKIVALRNKQERAKKQADKVKAQSEALQAKIAQTDKILSNIEKAKPKTEVGKAAQNLKTALTRGQPAVEAADRVQEARRRALRDITETIDEIKADVKASEKALEQLGKDYAFITQQLAIGPRYPTTREAVRRVESQISATETALSDAKKALAETETAYTQLLEKHATDTIENSIIRKGEAERQKIEKALTALQDAEQAAADARIKLLESKRAAPPVGAVDIVRVYRDTADSKVQADVAKERKNIAKAEEAHAAATTMAERVAAIKDIEASYNKVYALLNNAPLKQERMSDTSVAAQKKFDEAQAAELDKTLKLFEETAGIAPLKMTARRTIASVRNVRTGRIEPQVKKESVAQQERRFKQEQETGEYAASTLEKLAKANADLQETQRQINYIDANRAEPRTPARKRQDEARANAVTKRKELETQIKELKAAQKETVAEARTERQAEKELRKEAGRVIRRGQGEEPSLAPAYTQTGSAVERPEVVPTEDVQARDTRVERVFNVKADYTSPYHGKTYAEAAELAAENAKDPLTKELFQALAKSLAAHPVHDMHGRVFITSKAGFNEEAGWSRITGLFDPFMRFVLSPNEAVSADSELVLLHELSHAATLEGLKTNKALNDTVTSLRDRVEAWLKTPEGSAYYNANKEEISKGAGDGFAAYGLTDNAEFLAEVFSNQSFQALLRQIPSSTPRRSVWQSLVDTFAKFFALRSDGQRSLLEDALEATDRAMAATRAAERGISSPAFKKWFGRSQIVDEDDRPLVVYHGTDKSFDTFSESVKPASGAMHGKGFYFANAAHASAYADLENGNVMPVYLRMESPFYGSTLSQTDINRMLRRMPGFEKVYKDWLEENKGSPAAKPSIERLAVLSGDRNNFIQTALKAAGYDGRIVKTFTDDPLTHADTEFVVFDREQIKSAIGNTGAFGRNVPSIVGSPENLRLFNRPAAYVSPEWASAGEDIGKVVAQQRTWGDKIKANATGLAFETQLVDRFAAFERLRKYMPEQMGTQMMYYLRMYDQRMNFVSQAVSNGALRLAEKTRPDGKTEYLIESKEGANITNVVEVLRGAQPFIGNAEAVNQAFTTYLAALRADRVGLAKLNFGGSVTQEMLDRTMRMVNGNDKLKDVFEKARREYNAYNRDQIAMVAATGAISKETEAALTRTEDYIPFYRAQNGVVELLIGGEAPMRIGSIADQPYLQELVGGDQPILDFMTSSVQNTNMLVDMALRNLATKNAVFELVNLGAAKIVAGKPQGRDVVQFKVDGQDRYAVISSEKVTIGGKTFETGVPADILVKGMEGIPTQMPFLFRAMAMPAQLLRKAVTLSPLYMAKQLFRDSLAAPIVSGANFTPVMGALRQIGKESGKALETRGITGGQYMTGSADDITKILRDISDGKPGWMSALSKAEAVGMKADALTRRAQYNSYIEQGMSEMEATLMALESMNFNKRGASPSIHVANALIPFFNAQIQGLNVLYKAMSGKMPFNDKLKIQQKLLVRGGMMAAASLLYAALMDDDEAYKNATPDQKYGNWFVRVPGVDQPIRVPVPFEIGYIFKALPEALYNSMTDKHGNEDAVKAFKQILLQSVPGGSSYGIPQIMKPAIEAGLGKSFYTGRDILSAREKELLPEDQFRANTAEISKVVGKAMGISPIVMENLVRGYTGTMGLAFLHALSLGAPKSESPEAAVKRLSDYPIVGGSFQPNDAGGITNAVYERFNEDIKVRNSYKKMVEEGRSAEAKDLLQRRGNEIMEAEIADVFKQNMNKLTQAERAIAASSLTPDQKRKQLDELRKLKTAISQTMRETADKTVKLSSPL
jgi:hypothetical protein